MAYVAPTTRANGYVVDASEWNKNTVDNPIALRTGELAIASQATGDVITADSATQLGRVAAVATGQVLVSGGVGAPPAYSANPSVTSLTTSGIVTVGGVLTASDTTDSSSSVTGAVKIAGGVGIAKKLFAGSDVAITGDVYTVAQTDYYASSTITGWSSLTAGRRYIIYKKIGKMVFVNFHLEGASNSTAVSFTLPYAARTQYGSFGASLTLTYDNSAALTTAGIVTIAGGSSTANCYSNGAAGAWTAANNKIVSSTFWYWTD